MSPDEFLAKMEAIANNKEGFDESNHIEADSLLCQVLSELGYSEGVQVFRKMQKFYS